MIRNLEQYDKIYDAVFTKQDLENFENNIIEHWENAKIRGPVHLSNGNEAELIEIFTRIKKSDWVFSTWRSHYHALLKGIDPDWITQSILEGKSITLCNIPERFYSSAIVGGTLSIALGVAQGLKDQSSTDKVWCFVGDMCFESGLFMETHKYARNFDLPLYFVVEDNGIATNTPTVHTWNKKTPVPDDVIYYEYQSKYPHYGTGKWVIF